MNCVWTLRQHVNNKLKLIKTSCAQEHRDKKCLTKIHFVILFCSMLSDLWLHVSFRKWPLFLLLLWCVFGSQYDVTLVGQTGAGGEYEFQTGFGWTNGVVLQLLNEYGKDATVYSNSKCSFVVNFYCCIMSQTVVLNVVG